MTVFHGTTLLSALNILKEGKVEAHKVLPKHQHAYASFTNKLTVAHDFGRIILAFADSFERQLIPVYEFDLKWMLSNVEIIEYTVEMEQSYEELYDEAMSHIDKKEEFFELVSKGDSLFEPNQVEVMVCGLNPEQSQLAFSQLKEQFGDKYRISYQPEITQLVKELDEAKSETVFPNDFPDYLIMNNKEELLTNIA